jgi:hypothetical protein
MTKEKTNRSKENNSNPPVEPAVSSPPADNNPDFNPLAEAVNEKSYSKMGAQQFSPQQLQGDIPEPVFTPPPPEEEEIPTADRGNGSSSRKEKEQKQEPAGNPGLTDLSDKDKMDAAEKGAKLLMNLYKSAHDFANNMLEVSDRKLNKLQMSGELDMNILVPYGTNGAVRFGDFVQDYNSQCKEVLTVTPEFEKDVMPPLTRVLAKRGHGMTDEQYLAFAFGRDVLTKSFIFFQMKAQVNQIINFGKEQTASGGYKPQAHQPAQETTVAAQGPSMQQEEVPIVDQEMQQVVPLQDKILAQHLPTVSEGQSGLPQFGNRGALSNLEMAQASTEKISSKSRIASAKSKVKKTADTASIPQPGKKKRGRKLGSKNRNKLLK